MSAQVAFGRRGGNSWSRPAIEAEKVLRAVTEPSAAQAELADIARAAFQGRRSTDTSFDPPIAAGLPRALDDEEAMRAFIGPNWRAYWRLWERSRSAPRLRASFGLGPGAFGAIWLVYRKQYLLGFGLLAAEASIAFLAPPLAPVASLVSRLFIGRYGKSLVLIAGAAETERQRARVVATNARLRELRNAGGVTPWLPVLLLLGEAWLAVHQARLPEANMIDVAGLFANIQHALP